ncbi:Uncharacterized protein TCM_017655 [Theobroma cacao]|uniref:Uncharacterized protein n=1 Tax=Theobroma cacao TaxID=3641 RepID=A0A061ELE2_THECC|nr:Uncharacterized protein TCM_017655 [Theobroma cacao]
MTMCMYARMVEITPDDDYVMMPLVKTTLGDDYVYDAIRWEITPDDDYIDDTICRKITPDDDLTFRQLIRHRT